MLKRFKPTEEADQTKPNLSNGNGKAKSARVEDEDEDEMSYAQGTPFDSRTLVIRGNMADDSS